MKDREIELQVALLLKDSESRVRNAAAMMLGAMKAKKFAPQLAQLLKDPDVRHTAAEALAEMEATEFAPQVAELLKDPATRYGAVKALGEIKAREFAPQIALLLKDSSRNVRTAATRAIRKLGKQDLPVILQILDAINAYNTNSDDLERIAYLRFLAHFVAGGNQDVETLMQWLGKPKTTPQKVTYQQARKVMELFDKAWKVDEKLPDLRRELAVQIAEITRKNFWKPQDIGLLTKHYENLKDSYDIQANVVNSVIVNLEGWKRLFAVRNIIITHIIFWLALIFAYPKSKRYFFGTLGYGAFSVWVTLVSSSPGYLFCVASCLNPLNLHC